MTPAERQAKFYAAHPERRAIYSKTYYEAHKDRVKAANEAWRAANPEKEKAWRRAYNAAHREHLLAKGRRWYATHREYYAAKHAAYAPAHRDLLVEIEARRRTRKQGNGVLKVAPRDWRRMLHRYRNSCAYCGATGVRLHQDHVVPISRGGRHSIGNLLPACRPCNGRKGSRLLVEWRR